MLVLTRKAGGEIVIGVGTSQIRVRVIRCRGDDVRLGITAPAEVPILRTELVRRTDSPLPSPFFSVFSVPLW